MSISLRKVVYVVCLSGLLAAASVMAQLSPEEALAKMKAKEDARKAATQPLLDDLTTVRAVNADLRKENAALKGENSTLKNDNELLKIENDQLKKELAEARRIAKNNAGGGSGPSKTIFEGLEKETKKK